MRLAKGMKTVFRRPRFLVFGVLALTAILSVTGCGLVSSTGQSLESASAQVSAVDGVASAVVKEGGAWNGFTHNTYIAVQVTLEDGVVVKDPEVFVDYLFAVAWSQNETPTNMGVLLSVHGDQGSPAAINLKNAAEAAGWRLGVSANASFASVENSAMEARFGPWPGPVPESPDSLR